MSKRRRIAFLVVLALALVCAAAFLGLRPGSAAATGQGQPVVQMPSTDPASVDPAAKSAGPVAARVQELTSLRTADSKTYALADGKQEWVGYGEAVHYKDANGVFQDIDDSIVSDAKQIDGSSYAFRNGANAFTARFGASAADPRLIKLEYQGASIAFGLAGANGSAAAKTADAKSKALSDMTYGENLVGYPDVYPGIDLFYELKTYGIKEYLTLRQPGATNQFTFNLALGGLTPSKADDGRITLVNAKGEILFWLGEPVAVDDAGVATKDVSYSISGKGSAYTLSVTVSPSYLADPTRAYPVVVDPDLMITGNADTYDTWACSLYPSNTYTNDTYLRTGKDTTYGMRRTFLRFDLAEAQDVNPSNITDAYIRLEKYSGVSPTIKAYRNTMSWSSGTVCWSNMPTFSNSETSLQATNDSGAWWRMYNLTVVQKWLNGTYSPYGWTIIDSTENDTNHWTTFYACDAPSPHKPEMHIVFSPGYIVKTTLACDGVFRTAAGSSWSSIANTALETADNAFVSNFGIDFQIKNTSAWSSPLDGCSYKPNCSSSHSWSHVNPITMMDDAASDLGMSGINVMVSITGAHMLKDPVYGDEVGRAYNFGSNKCISIYDYAHIPTYVEIRHELSHLYNAPDHDPDGIETECVMWVTFSQDRSYVLIPFPTVWCSSCYDTIYANRSLHSS